MGKENVIKVKSNYHNSHFTQTKLPSRSSKEDHFLKLLKQKSTEPVKVDGKKRILG